MFFRADHLLTAIAGHFFAGLIPIGYVMLAIDDKDRNR